MSYVQIVLTIVGFISCTDLNIEATRDFSGKKYYDEYYMILKNFNQKMPGSGIDYFNEEKKNRPMAYGLILSAESNRYFHTNDFSALEMSRLCGNWLLDHSDINNDGIHGFGLADEWDAFQDGSINPENQEYTITTAIAIKGLLDWYEIEVNMIKRAEIRQIVLQSLTPFLDTSYDSPIGIPVYSFNSSDVVYDVFNPAVYLAGQMIRFTKMVEDQSLNDILTKKSSRIIEILLNNSLKDNSGNLFWLYGLQYNRANDLVHACYIIEGLRDFSRYNGNLAEDWDTIFNHLYLFKSENRWYEWNQQEFQNDDYNSRLWALGMLIYTMAKEGKIYEIEDTLIKQLDNYNLGDGNFKYKTNDDRQMVRQDAHLLLGLSYYIFN